ncbi:unnamed protein product [Gongylonema pulchrum]|uniref:Uncharacterized protein n=1 Tax=Gongylonema pulchrum TaxID=637853 RepID=A0A183D714_9BILA|nr:unnamed protein product [Gongylonema pulchrum]
MGQRIHIELIGIVQHRLIFLQEVQNGATIKDRKERKEKETRRMINQLLMGHPKMVDGPDQEELLAENEAEVGSKNDLSPNGVDGVIQTDNDREQKFPGFRLLERAPETEFSDCN